MVCMLRLAGCNVKRAIFTPTFWRAILTRKVGHTDLVFGVQPEFINRSVHAILQVSVCSIYDLFHSG